MIEQPFFPDVYMATRNSARAMMEERTGFRPSQIITMARGMGAEVAREEVVMWENVGRAVDRLIEEAHATYRSQRAWDWFQNNKDIDPRQEPNT